MNKKILSLFLAVVLIFTGGITVYAENDTTINEDINLTTTTTTEASVTSSTDTTKPTENEAVTSTTVSDKQRKEIQKKLEAQQKELQKNLDEAEKKLALLEKDSKVTVEYIDTLDCKIGYINEQLTVLQAQNDSIQQDIDKLKPAIKKNQHDLDVISTQIEETKNELDKMEKKFQAVYEAYCMRLRVLYISGSYNVLSALLSSEDISGFLTRFEMIRSVSKSDSELLAEVDSRMDEIVTKRDGYNEQLEKFKTVSEKLKKQKSDLVEKQDKIESNTQQIAANKASLATDRAESDRLLAELNAQNLQYTEFRNEDEELINAVENEIQSLISGLKKPEEVTTAAIDSDRSKTNGKLTTNKTADVYYGSDAVLNMTYPIPGYYGVSAGFPNYSSGKYHGGIDFPCPTGSKVVAVQDGIVITVKRLNYSYGYYVMIYHGTDSKGRSVVTLYAHNSSILVSNGQSVKKGQQIASSGSTGNSTGPHCHFEIRFDGTRVNPTNYLSK